MFDTASMNRRMRLQHRRKDTVLLRTITDNDRMPEPDRLRGLVDAGIALSSELSLDDLLKKLAETAAGLTGARYAALGVIDETGTGLERFVHTGIDAETVDRIGELPRGRGILGALITDARSLRLNAITDDSRSVGFPPNHPPMRGLSRRADRSPRAGLRKPLPDREGRGRLHRRGSGTGRDAGQPGCGGDRERTPLRGRDQLVGAARGAERGRDGAGRRDRATASA